MRKLYLAIYKCGEENGHKPETRRIILGDSDSLKSVAQELKARDIKPSFEQGDEDRFVLTITR